MKRHSRGQPKIQIEPMVERAARPRHTQPKKSKAVIRHARKASKIRLRDETLREGAILVREYVSPTTKKTRWL